MKVLTYHSIDASGSVISVHPDAFASHMRNLARRGFKGVRFDALIDAWRGLAPLPAKAVVLTFDDAYVNFAEHAAPVLLELGFTATVFAVSRSSGKFNDWPDQDASIPRLQVLDWAELRRLSEAGFEIGSHSATHARLEKLGQADARREVVDSRREIEDRIGAPVRTFAYPFGVYDAACLELVARTYDGACTTRLGTARRGNPHEVDRIEMYYLRSARLFRLFGTPPGAAYLALRSAGRWLRGTRTAGDTVAGTARTQEIHGTD